MLITKMNIFFCFRPLKQDGWSALSRCVFVRDHSWRVGCKFWSRSTLSGLGIGYTILEETSSPLQSKYLHYYATKYLSRCPHLDFYKVHQRSCNLPNVNISILVLATCSISKKDSIHIFLNNIITWYPIWNWLCSLNRLRFHISSFL